MIVWLNKYFGPVTHGGKKFEEMQVYWNNRDKIPTLVTMPQRNVEYQAGKLIAEKSI